MKLTCDGLFRSRYGTKPVVMWLTRVAGGMWAFRSETTGRIEWGTAAADKYTAAELAMKIFADYRPELSLYESPADDLFAWVDAQPPVPFVALADISR